MWYLSETSSSWAGDITIMQYFREYERKEREIGERERERKREDDLNRQTFMYIYIYISWQIYLRHRVSMVSGWRITWITRGVTGASAHFIPPFGIASFRPLLICHRLPRSSGLPLDLLYVQTILSSSSVFSDNPSIRCLALQISPIHLLFGIILPVSCSFFLHFFFLMFMGNLLPQPATRYSLLIHQSIFLHTN